MKHDSQFDACKHVGLAHSAVGAVAVCPGCGVIHLSLHYLSLRFEPSAFRELTHMLATAQICLDRQEGLRSPVVQPEDERRPGGNLH